MAIFLYGFAKNARENIASDDLEDLKSVAVLFLGLSGEKIQRAIETGELNEVGQNDGKV